MANFITRIISTILRVIFKILPNHTKRLVLWSTLYSKICGARKYSKEEAQQLGERLNNVLTITKDTKAFIFPVGMSQFISSDLDGCSNAIINAVRNTQTAEAAAKEFVRQIPQWLRYASEPFMVRDFSVLLTVHHRA